METPKWFVATMTIKDDQIWYKIHFLFNKYYLQRLSFIFESLNFRLDVHWKLEKC